jgi:hypothetical protein
VVASSRLLGEGRSALYSRRAVLHRLRALCPVPDLLPKD